jgi:hypothetical protein
MAQKNDVILLAMQLGFFRTKSDEKKNEIIADMVDAEGMPDADTIGAILALETERRSSAYKKRQAKALAKAYMDAAKPISGGMDTVAYPTITGDRFIVTVAQNNTDVEINMLGALETFCEHNGAKLIVCRTYYNKSGFNHPEHGADSDGIYFDPAIAQYVVENPVYLGNDKMLLAANANVIPTAKNPLSGFEGMAKSGQDLIIPAVKIQLKCTASLKHARGKNLYSTGAVTKRNYVARKAGNVALHEHNIGALYVEFENGIPYCYQLEKMPESNGFYHEKNYYEPGKVSQVGDAVMTIQFGDIHAEKSDDSNIEKCIKICDQLNPCRIVLHDILDMQSRNHHNVKDASFLHRMDRAKNSVVKDLNKVIQIIEQFREHADVSIIESNHDLALQKWVIESDWKKDTINAVFYLRATAALLENSDTPDFNLLQYACEQMGGTKDIFGNTLAELTNNKHGDVYFHRTDESVMLSGVEHGCHGHNGVNGARASGSQHFRQLGIPINTGHTHSPSISGMAYTSGVTGALDMGYNAGPSSWRIAHIVTYRNGQRQIWFCNPV